VPEVAEAVAALAPPTNEAILRNATPIEKTVSRRPARELPAFDPGTRHAAKRIGPFLSSAKIALLPTAVKGPPGRYGVPRP
jgi:hypothetical protein